MLTPQMIEAMNKATGNTVPLDGKAPVQSRAAQIRSLVPSAPAPVAPEPGFAQRVGSDFMQRGQEVVNAVTKPSQDVSSGKSLGKIGLDIGAAGLNTAGAVAGGALDIVGEGAKSLFSILPSGVKDAINNAGSSFLQSKNVTGETNQETIQKLNALAEKHPDAAKALTSSLNIAGILGLNTSELSATGGKGLPKVALDEARALPGQVSDVASSIKGSVENTAGSAIAKVRGIPLDETAANKLIDSTYMKAVKPSTAGIKGSGQLEKYMTNARTAIKDIAKNSQEAPRSLQETLDAVSENKARIWGEVEKANEAAGKGGTQIDLKKVAESLDEVIDNKAVKIANPQAIDYARNLRERLLSEKSLTPTEAQNLVTEYNAELKSFFRNPQVGEASKSVINAAVRNGIVNSLDEAIESVGSEAKSFRQLYGSYKTVESDIAKAAARVAKRNAVGLPDYTNIISGADIVKGLVTMNPGEVVRGGTMNVIKNYFKYLNDPDVQIQKMFQGLKGGEPGVLGKTINTVAESPRGGFMNFSGENPKVVQLQDTWERLGRNQKNLSGQQLKNNVAQRAKLLDQIRSIKKQ